MHSAPDSSLGQLNPSAPGTAPGAQLWLLAAPSGPVSDQMGKGTCGSPSAKGSPSSSFVHLQNTVPSASWDAGSPVTVDLCDDVPVGSVNEIQSALHG